jgi:hypothetical protein
MLYRKLLVFFLLALWVLSCSKDEPPKSAPQIAPEERPQPETAPAPPEAAPPQIAAEPLAPPRAEKPPESSPLAIIKSGANPLWFELDREENEGEDAHGPFLIAVPDAASLTPFAPWTLARFVAGIVMYQDRLVIGINREGFLMVAPRKDGSLALYRIADDYWENYTIGSMFVFEENPAVLLYRDDFFVDLVEPPPSHKVFTHISGKTEPIGVTVPAFDPFPSSAGWDIDTLRQGPDGYWYYRGIRRGSAETRPKTVHFRTARLSLPGESVSLSEFRNSALPASLSKAPSLLRSVMDEVFRLIEPSAVPIAGIISPEFSYIRYFTRDPSLSASGQQLLELSGYYLQTDSGAQALAVLPDGRGILGKTRAGNNRIEPITLPALPEGFVYTKIGLSGDTLIGAWEEQQDMSVGAAGLMIMRLP